VTGKRWKPLTRKTRCQDRPQKFNTIPVRPRDTVMRWKRKSLVVAICFVALWSATAFLGAPAIRAKQIHAMGLDSPRTGTLDISYLSEDVVRQTAAKHGHLWPWFECRTFACFPLIVRAKYGSMAGPEAGGGGVAYYFWCFGFSYQLRDVNTWVS